MIEINEALRVDDTKVIYKGYTEAQLKAAFEAVEDPTDWRNPIAAWVMGEHVLPVVAAIEFYTATVPQVQLNVADMKYLVTSEGYRNGPAGP